MLLENGNDARYARVLKFIDSFVCGIGNIYVKFNQETLFIIQNIVEQCL